MTLSRASDLHVVPRSQYTDHWEVYLNLRLAEFYSTSGAVTAAPEWLAKHDFRKGFEDSEDEWLHH